MSSIQGDFIAALKALAPEGVTARIQTRWANTGTVYYQDSVENPNTHEVIATVPLYTETQECNIIGIVVW